MAWRARHSLPKWKITLSPIHLCWLLKTECVCSCLWWWWYARMMEASGQCAETPWEKPEAKLCVSQTESIALRKSFQKTDHKISLQLRKCKFIDKVLFPEDKVYSGSFARMMTSIITQDISWQEGSHGLGVRSEPPEFGDRPQPHYYEHKCYTNCFNRCKSRQ